MLELNTTDSHWVKEISILPVIFLLSMMINYVEESVFISEKTDISI